MSWNFSVTGSNPQEVFEKFQEKLWQNGAHVPFSMADDINSAAARLAQIAMSAAGAQRNAPPTVRNIRLETYGHFNEEGDGNVGVTLHVLPPEPAKPQDDDQNGQ